MLTVRDIPALKGLEKIRIRSGLKYIDKAIRWPYIAEDHELEPWLAGGEVIFITGINRAWPTASFATLLDVAERKQVAAIVVLTGSAHMPELPSEWVELAEEHQVPLLEQPYSLPMVTVTERLSNAIIQDSFANRSQQWFLMQLIENPTSPEAIHLAQAREFDFPLENALSVAMVLPQLDENFTVETWQFALKEFLREQASPFPLLDYRNGWLLILPATATQEDTSALMPCWRELHQKLVTHGLSASIGIADGQLLPQLNRMVYRARQCADFVHRHYTGQLFHHSTFGVQQLFACIDDQQKLSDFCRNTLGPFYHAQSQEQKQIKQTLRSYFNELCSVRKTAAQMEIHRNTVTSRLTKFEQLTHQTLTDANHRLAIQNALLIEAFILPHDESL